MAAAADVEARWRTGERAVCAGVKADQLVTDPENDKEFVKGARVAEVTVAWATVQGLPVT